jgi:hypothetical protein
VKKTMMLVAALAAMFGNHAAWALSCQARQGQTVFKGVGVDESDIQITLSDGRFVWVGLVGRETMTVGLMRPATPTEMEKTSRNGDRNPPTATETAHADASLAKLSSGVEVGGYVVTCKAAGCNTDQKTGDFGLSLKVPEAPAAIPALKAEILRRFEAASKIIKDNAAEDKETDPQNFHPYSFDSEWRVTFDSPQVISLSASNATYNGGAHPNSDYDSIVWDKTSGSAMALSDLFAKADLRAALHDIAEHAKASLRKKFPREEGQPADFDPVEGNIAADPEKLGHYALTYAKGESKANGIVLLWGAGAPWPNVMGDIKLSVPAAVFRKYLTPQWAAEFK